MNLQSNRIDVVTESVQKAQKIVEENAEFLQSLLVGVENMGENLKKFREEMEGWKSAELQNAEREHEAINVELLTEVSLSVPAVTEPIQILITPVPSTPHCTSIISFWDCNRPSTSRNARTIIGNL